LSRESKNPEKGREKIEKSVIWNGEVYFWFLLRHDLEINPSFICQGFGEEERHAHKESSAHLSIHYFVSLMKFFVIFKKHLLWQVKNKQDSLL